MNRHLSEVEKRRKRRESHNAVERRRRDNINERIHELAGMVPPSPQEMEDGGDNVADGKLHKGLVLKRSIDYIRALQQENERLRTQLHK